MGQDEEMIHEKIKIFATVDKDNGEANYALYLYSSFKTRGEIHTQRNKRMGE